MELISLCDYSSDISICSLVIVNGKEIKVLRSILKLEQTSFRRLRRSVIRMPNILIGSDKILHPNAVHLLCQLRSHLQDTFQLFPFQVDLVLVGMSTSVELSRFSLTKA